MQITDKIFQKNLEQWSKTCPKQAFMLPYVNCSALRDCATQRGEANLEYVGTTHQNKSLSKKGKTKTSVSSFVYHAESGAVQEAHAWFQSLSLHKMPMICIYGVGLGYYYDAVIDWLKRDRSRRVIFFEDDLAVIHKLFETERGYKIINDPQVQLLYFDDLEKEESVLSTFYWNVAMKRFVVSALNSYEQSKKDVFSDLRHKISYDIAMKNALVEEYVGYGTGFYLNFYENLLCLPDSYLGNKLFNKFHQVPAIICGAGPSLTKHFSQLQKLLDHAVVFAGGSAINALNKAGFNPHFGVSIDPNPTQLERIRSNKCYEVPFFYRNRIYHDALKAIRGPRLYITGSGGYDTAEYFEKKFKINDEFLDEGHNVINFCVEIAHRMGCGPIIFVGMDLALTGMQTYAPGIVENTAVKESPIVDVVSEEKQLVPRKDIYGKPINTLWKWIAESEWIGKYAKDHPLLKMINCTEGGIGFPNVPNMPLAEVIPQYLSQQYELKNRIHGEIQNAAMPQVTLPKLSKGMKDLQKSLKKTIGHLDILLEESHTILDRLKSGSKDISQSGKAALAEIELVEEDGYKYVVDIFNIVYSCMLSGKAHEIYRRNYSESKRMLKKLPFTINKYVFLRDVARLNIEIISRAFREHKRFEEENPVKQNPIAHTSPPQMKEEPVPKNFNPVMIPERPVDKFEVSPEYCLRVFYDKKWKLSECYVEKDGRPDGQYRLYYPNGTYKEECYYKEGHLHGPSSFWNEDGQLLAKSWFVNGHQEGKSYWFYPDGAIYALQNYQKNLQHGTQEFYNSDGSLKYLLKYDHGRILEQAERTI